MGVKQMQVPAKDLARTSQQSCTSQIRYAIVTPARNEAAFLEEHLASVVSQTVRPAEWVIVDDGSTDATGAIVDRWAAQHAWIKSLHRGDRGFRQAGAGVIEAFYDGYHALRTHDWEYLVKLDGDLILNPDYFERCLEEFVKDAQLGIGGGIVYDGQNAPGKFEQGPSFHVRGAVKMYRRACWDAIGGLITSPGWDTVDELKANYLGWNTRSFAALKVLHLRPTGAVDGTWKNAVKNGRANYVTGYHPLFMLLKCLRRALSKPYVVGGLGLSYGFVSGCIRRIPRVNDPSLIRYIRRQQLRYLLHLKSIWN